jgi:gluconokinase
MNDVVIGVDVGTTSTKAIAFTVAGEAVAGGHRGYALTSRHPGYAEQDPDEVVAAATAATAEAVSAAVAAGYRVAGLSFSAAMHSVIGLDASGRPITPVVTWADRRAAEQARRLRTGPRGLALHRRTGTPVHPMSPVVKLRWFLDEQPGVALQVRHWVGIKDYLLYRLTGELVVDHSMASAMGMFHLEHGGWDPEALAYAGVTEAKLPELVPTTAVLRLRHGGLGLSDGTPLVVGGGDGPLANLGVGAIRPGAVACSIGTSGALRVASDRPMVDARGRVFCYVLAPGRWIVGGAVNNGGHVLEWLGDAVAPGLDPSAVLAEAARADAGCGGLLFLPYLLGERAPHWSGDPRAVYLGLTREHRRHHLLRAGLEGVCLQLAVVLTALGEAGVDVREIRATGGFSRSPLWRRILAGTFGRPVGFAASPEGSSLGAALLGATALGLLDDLDRAAELVRVTEVTQPDPVDAEVYAALLPIFDSVFEALTPAFDALARVHVVPPTPELPTVGGAEQRLAPAPSDPPGLRRDRRDSTVIHQATPRH